MLTVRSIASGSDGNAVLVATDQGAVLLDAGLGAARLRSHLAEMGNDESRLAGIVLTHEHNDHARGAASLARQIGVPIYATDATLPRLPALKGVEINCMPRERPFSLGGLTITAFGVHHDAADPVGLLVEHGDYRIALATDLGCVDDHLIEWICQADLVILEANHDLERLWAGPYQYRLKRRIASPTGHLSNEQAAVCLAAAAERGRTRWVWLAHLSEVNNSQRAALRAVASRLDGAPISVEVARRSRPSLVWRSATAYLQGRLL